MRKNTIELMKTMLKYWAPPERLKVSEWADKYRMLSSGSSSEPGGWHTSRTPYMFGPMEAFTDPKVEKIYIMSSAQVGKSELLLNLFGYIVDIDPGAVLWIMPTVEAAEDFSKQRLSAMIRDTAKLHNKIASSKSRDKNNTILKKFFAGGSLSMVGSNAPTGLRSRPIRYVLGDEWDAWAYSAGVDGDPADLAEERTATFYNRKIVMVSTPTIKDQSRIERAYLSGTQEKYMLQCPSCGEYHFIEHKSIRYEHEMIGKGNKKIHIANNIRWYCPSCLKEFNEHTMKQQPGKWFASNPEAYERGLRSFRFNAWVSPWRTWEYIVEKFLSANAEKDTEKLKVVINTLFGESFEDRGELENEDYYLARREEYKADLPDGVLALTCGIDTQDNRLEYEVVGHGHSGQTWGINRGIIIGKPDTDEVWEKLDAILDKVYYFENGKGLVISLTCVDSGGHYTQEVYEACRNRLGKRVFAIKGKGGDGVSFINPPTRIPIRQKNITTWLYTIGVDAGKASIMQRLKVETPGPKYCHFPSNPECGYDYTFFNGLLSEKLTLKGEKWRWEKLPGHAHNEALDCRNYALAAFSILNPNLHVVEKRLKDVKSEKPKKVLQSVVKKVKKGIDLFD